MNRPRRRLTIAHLTLGGSAASRFAGRLASTLRGTAGLVRTLPGEGSRAATVAIAVVMGTALCALAPAGLAAAAFAQSADPGEHYIMRVRVTDRHEQIPRLAEMQLDLAGVDVKADTADFVGDASTYDALREAGFVPEIVWISTAPGESLALSQYLDPVEVSQKLDFYASAYPTLARKVAIATTVQGRTEWALAISDNVSADEDEPVVLYVGQHHAREVMTPEIAIDIIDYLLTRYASDPQVQAWVDGREIWVVPSHNPDGTNTVFTTNTGWRKNRRPNPGGSFGVDPNRNYPFRWNYCGGSSGTPTSDTYRGPSAGSEPETQGLMALASAHRPVLSMTYHTYSQLVIHPYGCTSTTNSEMRLFRDHTSDMAVRVSNDTNDGWYSNGTAYELLYQVDGDSDTWLYGELGAIATTIEANASVQGFQPDYNIWRDQTVQRNRPAWQYLLDRIDGPSVWGHTIDACTGTPLSATISLDEIVLTGGETPRTSEPGFGRYHRLTIPGAYHMRVTKPGYGTQVWPVDIGFEAVRREVRLAPAGAFAVEALGGTILDAGGAGDGDGEADPGESVGLAVPAYATGGAVSGLSAVLATADPYVTVTDANGAWASIGAGGSALTSDDFAIAVSPSAPEGHVAVFTLTFTADQSLCAPASALEIPLTGRASSCPAIDEPLDANPGWTIENTTGSGWAFGAPLSGGVGGPGSAHTGASVYGTNLTGTYADGADERLTTTPFNLAGLHGTELRFWRWLNNEAGFDLASIDVSADGTNYTTVWSGFGRDAQWEQYRIDISAIADDQPTVRVRFRLQSDVGGVAAGFYVDDVSICGRTNAPAPRLAVASWTASDAGNPQCSDGDSYGDGGEAVDLTVNVRNNGSAPAVGAAARLASGDPRIALAIFRAPLGDLAPGASAPAAFRIAIPAGIPCGTIVPFQIDLASNDGAFTAQDTSLALTLNADDGAAVPDTIENFESAAGWTLTGEWQIGAPMGMGGTANGGAGSPDPTSAVSGTKVLGVDLTGLGSQPGSYENSVTTAITATSPSYDCSSSTHVEVQLERWLGVERSLYDKATLEAWNGSAWQAVWQNPDGDMSDASWQAVSYDVSSWAAGNPAFRVRFNMTSDGSLVYCGWNIDDLRITNGYTPQLCEGAPCAAGCAPSAEVQGLALQKTGGAVTAGWPAASDPCLNGLGASYRVYRCDDPSPRIPAPVQWPQDSYFMDVTGRDTDGDASNLQYRDDDLPPPGGVFFYLVVALGTNGSEGPKGWQGF